ncbi:MAG: stage sporulation family protein [Edaphobacter sp.]|nr:stage sporulation family protein [Edaphobacter sp.]
MLTLGRVSLSCTTCGIVLADVSGKGMPAALLMAATRAILRSLVKFYPRAGRILMQLNQTLMDDLPIGKFVTMIYAVLDARSRKIPVASAGHLRPLLINRACSFLDVDSCMPLGSGTSSYPECTIPLKPGTQLLFYTDGSLFGACSSFSRGNDSR